MTIHTEADAGSNVYDGLLALERMERAVLKVRERLLRATAALEAAGVPYAVVGGNAVAAWIEQVDETAVRATQDVDIAVRRPDFGAVRAALEGAGFVHRTVSGLDVFLDAPTGRVRDAVHIVFAGEPVRPDHVSPAPDVSEATSFQAFRVANLEALVRMKLTSYRDKDRTHLRDLIDVGLVDGTWPARLEPALAERLQRLLDTPDG